MSGPDTVSGGLGPRGQVLFKLYREMWYMRWWNRTVWWWQEYGRDGNFTLVDFLATIYVYELAGLDVPQLSGYVEAMGRHAYSWCRDNRRFPKPFTCASTTNRGMLYFIASWSEVARRIAGNCTNGCTVLEEFPAMYQKSHDWALKVAQGIKNPLPSWRIFDRDALWDAGNVHPNVIKLSKVIEMHDKYHHDAYYDGGEEEGAFFITTYCETLFLHGNMSAFNGEGCTLPPN